MAGVFDSVTMVTDAYKAKNNPNNLNNPNYTYYDYTSPDEQNNDLYGSDKLDRLRLLLTESKLPSSLQDNTTDADKQDTTPLQWKQDNVQINDTSNNTDKTSYKAHLYTITPNKNLQANVKGVVDFFKKNGYGISTYGFIGNFLGESNLNAKAINNQEKNAGLSGYGVGIALWSNSRKKDFKNVMGVDPEHADLETLLKFVLHEVDNRKQLKSILKKIDTDYNAGHLTKELAIEKATSAVLLGYENGSNNGLISVDKFNSIYMPNKFNGHSYDHSLRKRTQKALNSYIG